MTVVGPSGCQLGLLHVVTEVKNSVHHRQTVWTRQLTGLSAVSTNGVYIKHNTRIVFNDKYIILSVRRGLDAWYKYIASNGCIVTDTFIITCCCSNILYH